MDYMSRGGVWYFNRWASFFVYLDEEAEGGETWFPHLNIPIPLHGSDSEEEMGSVKWMKDEKGGTKFLPKKGNALFWVNLHANGTGDERVVHAGREVKEGRKTAMNLWPRVFYGGDGR